jgi:hypothetical protein
LGGGIAHRGETQGDAIAAGANIAAQPIDDLMRRAIGEPGNQTLLL